MREVLKLLTPMKPYLLVFNTQHVWPQTMLNYLDTRAEVLNWYSFIDTGIFIISRHTAYQLGEALRQGFPGLFFVITEVTRTNYDGWLPQVAWDFILNPKSSGRWE